ncbi:MAG: hypothetical protein KF832_13405 [Caldilineaceae bacterium]|nr:hypothetical protein [Caldilineaceae bacterium]
MGNKSRNSNYDILDKILADSNPAQRAGFPSVRDDEKVDGTWITSQEQFDRLQKSVDDIEKYLRS